MEASVILQQTQKGPLVWLPWPAWAPRRCLPPPNPCPMAPGWGNTSYCDVSNLSLCRWSGSGAAVSWHGEQLSQPGSSAAEPAPSLTGSELRPPLRPPRAPLPFGRPLSTPGAAYTLWLLTHQWPPSRPEASQGGRLCITSVWGHSWVRKCFFRGNIHLSGCLLPVCRPLL